MCHRNYIASTFIFVAQKQKPKTGRPKLPKGEAKSEMVRARVTPSEYEAIARKAGKQGVSEWARTIMLEATR